MWIVGLFQSLYYGLVLFFCLISINLSAVGPGDPAEQATQSKSTGIASVAPSSTSSEASADSAPPTSPIPWEEIGPAKTPVLPESNVNSAAAAAAAAMTGGATGPSTEITGLPAPVEDIFTPPFKGCVKTDQALLKDSSWDTEWMVVPVMNGKLLYPKAYDTRYSTALINCSTRDILASPSETAKKLLCTNHLGMHKYNAIVLDALMPFLAYKSPCVEAVKTEADLKDQLFLIQNSLFFQTHGSRSELSKLLVTFIPVSDNLSEKDRLLINETMFAMSPQELVAKAQARLPKPNKPKKGKRQKKTAEADPEPEFLSLSPLSEKEMAAQRICPEFPTMAKFDLLRCLSMAYPHSLGARILKMFWPHRVPHTEKLLANLIPAIESRIQNLSCFQGRPAPVENDTHGTSLAIVKCNFKNLLRTLGLSDIQKAIKAAPKSPEEGQEAAAASAQQVFNMEDDATPEAFRAKCLAMLENPTAWTPLQFLKTATEFQISIRCAGGAFFPSVQYVLNGELHEDFQCKNITHFIVDDAEDIIYLEKEYAPNRGSGAPVNLHSRYYGSLEALEDGKNGFFYMTPDRICTAHLKAVCISRGEGALPGNGTQYVAARLSDFLSLIKHWRAQVAQDPNVLKKALRALPKLKGGTPDACFALPPAFLHKDGVPHIFVNNTWKPLESVWRVGQRALPAPPAFVFSPEVYQKRAPAFQAQYQAIQQELMQEFQTANENEPAVQNMLGHIAHATLSPSYACDHNCLDFFLNELITLGSFQGDDFPLIQKLVALLKPTPNVRAKGARR